MSKFIETTHVGSLPRGDELVPLLLARDHGQPYDAAEFDAVVQRAREIAEAGRELGDRVRDGWKHDRAYALVA